MSGSLLNSYIETTNRYENKVFWNLFSIAFVFVSLLSYFFGRIIANSLQIHTYSIFYIITFIAGFLLISGMILFASLKFLSIYNIPSKFVRKQKKAEIKDKEKFKALIQYYGLETNMEFIDTIIIKPVEKGKFYNTKNNIGVSLLSRKIHIDYITIEVKSRIDDEIIQAVIGSDNFWEYGTGIVIPVNLSKPQSNHELMKINKEIKKYDFDLFFTATPVKLLRHKIIDIL